jgi:hypothetical protein
LKRLAEAAWMPIDGVMGSPEGVPETVVVLKEHSLEDRQMIPEPPAPLAGSTH